MRTQAPPLLMGVSTLISFLSHPEAEVEPTLGPQGQLHVSQVAGLPAVLLPGNRNLSAGSLQFAWGSTAVISK